MRLPASLLRLRIRTLMIAVAVVGFSLAWTIEVPRRRARFQRLAGSHASAMLANTALMLESNPDPRWRTDDARRQREDQFREYHLPLVDKYQWAAQRPWLPVWPDPPKPE